MSAWTHTLCRRCWNECVAAEGQPDLTPVVVRDAPKEVCCRCGELTTDGIYSRGEPNRYPCGGKTGAHVEGGGLS